MVKSFHFIQINISLHQEILDDLNDDIKSSFSQYYLHMHKLGILTGVLNSNENSLQEHILQKE